MAYASMKILYDHDGKPYDYILADLNHVLAGIANVSVSEAVGKSVKEFNIPAELFIFLEKVASQGSVIVNELFSSPTEGIIPLPYTLRKKVIALRFLRT